MFFSFLFLFLMKKGKRKKDREQPLAGLTGYPPKSLKRHRKISKRWVRIQKNGLEQRLSKALIIRAFFLKPFGQNGSAGGWPSFWPDSNRLRTQADLLKRPEPQKTSKQPPRTARA
jgi:hypothetical protein